MFDTEIADEVIGNSFDQTRVTDELRGLLAEAARRGFDAGYSRARGGAATEVSDATERVIRRVAWSIGVMREKPSNRIADAVTLNARDVEALIEAVRRAPEKGD